MIELLLLYPLYILAAAVFIFAIWVCEGERNFFGFTAIFATVGLYDFFINNSAWFKYVVLNPVNVIYGILAYLAAGVVWSFIKWIFFVWKERDRYTDAKAYALKYLKVASLDELTDEKRENALRDIRLKSGVFGVPQASENKWKIITWMAWWPASAFWTILNDPIRRVFNVLYRICGNLYEKIAAALFGKLSADFDSK